MDRPGLCHLAPDSQSQSLVERTFWGLPFGTEGFLGRVSGRSRVKYRTTSFLTGTSPVADGELSKQWNPDGDSGLEPVG